MRYSYSNPKPSSDSPAPLLHTEAPLPISKFQQKRRSLANSILDYDTCNPNISNPEKRRNSQAESYPHGIHHNKGETHASDRPEVNNCVLNDDLYASKISKTERKGHNPLSCVCDYCTCGRHLCKIHINKPGMHHKSGYRIDYSYKNSSRPIQVIHSESPTLEGRITPMSTYGKEFYSRARSKDERVKPEDCIKNEGPFSGLTTYGAGFPDFKSDMTYPHGKHYGGEMVSNFPFAGNSNYRKEYTPKKSFVVRNLVKDNLKTGDSWLGNTTYKTNFNKPEESYVNTWVSKEMVMNDRNFDHQYETTYRNDFIKNRSTICPAKVVIETRSKEGFMRGTKMSFEENTDFKALDPQFHAISTSKVV